MDPGEKTQLWQGGKEESGEEPSMEDWFFCPDSPGTARGQASLLGEGPLSSCCHFRGSCVDGVS